MPLIAVMSLVLKAVREYVPRDGVGNDEDFGGLVNDTTVTSASTPLGGQQHQHGDDRQREPDVVHHDWPSRHEGAST